MELDRTKMTLAEHHNMAAASLDNITEQGTIADTTGRIERGKLLGNEIELKRTNTH